MNVRLERRRLSLRLILIIALALATLSVGRVDGSTTFSRYWEHDTVQAYGGLWSVQQTARFKITYNGFTKMPVRLDLIEARCTVNSLGIVISVNWCGGNRETALRYRMGFDFTKKPFWVIGSQDCWARITVRAMHRYDGVAGLYLNQEARGC